MTTATEVRQSLIDALALDLVGPGPGHPLESEQLWESEPPSRWYLTGFLVPKGAPEHQRHDPQAEEQIDAAVIGEEGTGDDDTEPEKPAARKVFLPSSIGVSVLVPADARAVGVEVLWGEYRKVPSKDATRPDRHVWQREQRREMVPAPLGNGAGRPQEVPNSRGLQLYVSARPVGTTGGDGESQGKKALSVSVFLVNERDAEKEERAEEALVFQVTLRLRLAEGFVPRPDMRGMTSEDDDERIADLQYKDVCEHAVGHGVATHALVGEDGVCREVETTWLPVAPVEKVDFPRIDGVTLSMEELASLPDAAAAKRALSGLPEKYASWIAQQKQQVPAGKRRAEVANELLGRCSAVKDRIQRGIDMLDGRVLQAFKIANRAMADAARQREAQKARTTPARVAPPKWRPFQLAFVLMTLPGIVEPTSSERKLVDLLFFPTGGGKTEAYLGLAAFTLVLRRLNNKTIASAGVSVLMRYTLRLLTLDQLGRAAGLVCALELYRQQDVETLGKWPFEIGLWVGLRATPNHMGRVGDNDRNSARAKTLAFQNNSAEKPAPIPLENCPWCGTKFGATSFQLVPNKDKPQDLHITCANEDCDFTRDNHLPIVAVDEPLYRRLPCFLIATVDKLACMPWLARPGKLFGKVEKYDAAGFYGPGEAPGGTRLPAGLPPPDLIVQDELHLISGPLGTMVGLYETAVEALCRREVGGEVVLPKIVASTATVRRAEAQIRALFNRQADVFPPPGPDRRDSFFAQTVDGSKKPPRLYVGVAAQGRSLKVVLLRSYLALLAAAKKQYEMAGPLDPKNPADPYMTLLGYFNALRELGGSRRIVEDEVRSSLRGYSRRRRANEADPPFVSRTIGFDALELTSRIETNKVAEAKRRLESPFSEPKPVDVALATNMISVGLDIVRLGLMVVLGQPKTSAEYIQATSRVGRDDERPGLVVTLLNQHRPRDRSHYERFEAYHASFYRAVEATSVTPFAPRAIDRGLAAVVVTLARHGEPALTPAASAAAIAQHRGKLGWLERVVRERAEEHAKDLDPAEKAELGAKIERAVQDLLDEWETIAAENAKQQTGLQYGPSEAKPRPPLLHTPLDRELKNEPEGSPRSKFKAQWSLRDVEAEVPLFVKRLDGGTLEGK